MKRSLAEAIRRLAWSGVSLPVRAVVDRAYASPAAGGYAADVEIVHRVSLDRSGEKLTEVPLQPLWLGGDGRGLFAPPEAGQYVIVSWIEGDRSCPFIAGASADRYSPAASAETGELRLVDGRGAELALSGRWRLATAQDSLRPVIEALIDAVVALTTVGPPSTHTVEPASKAALQAVKERVGALLDP